MAHVSGEGAAEEVEIVVGLGGGRCISGGGVGE